MVSVLVSEVELDPYRVFTVVPVMLIDVPITAFDTFVPNVVLEFNLSASDDVIPTPVKFVSNLTSAIVAE